MTGKSLECATGPRLQFALQACWGCLNEPRGYNSARLVQRVTGRVEAGFPRCRRPGAGRPIRLGSGGTEIVPADREAWLLEKGSASEASARSCSDLEFGPCRGPRLGDRACPSPRRLVREARAGRRPWKTRSRSLATARSPAPNYQSRGHQDDRDPDGDQFLDPKFREQAEVVRETGVRWVVVPMRGSRATPRTDGACCRLAGRPHLAARLLSLRRGSPPHQPCPCRILDPASRIHRGPGLAGGFRSAMGQTRLGRGSQRPLLDRGVCQGAAIAGSIPRTGRLGDWP